MKTKDEIISITEATVAAYSNSPVWYKSDIEKYMEKYANEVKKDLSDKEKTMLQEFYTVGKIQQIRDKVITGSFAIGSNGFKEPNDWKAYAERLEEYIINTMIKERKI